MKHIREPGLYLCQCYHFNRTEIIQKVLYLPMFLITDVCTGTVTLAEIYKIYVYFNLLTKWPQILRNCYLSKSESNLHFTTRLFSVYRSIRILEWHLLVHFAQMPPENQANERSLSFPLLSHLFKAGLVFKPLKIWISLKNHKLAKLYSKLGSVSFKSIVILSEPFYGSGLRFESETNLQIW